LQGIEVVVARQQQAWSAITKGGSRKQHFPVVWSKTELQQIPADQWRHRGNISLAGWVGC
jgi:hypothetical protein